MGDYRKWYQESIKIEFERIILLKICKYDGYLLFKFGKYMELLSIE